MIESMNTKLKNDFEFNFKDHIDKLKNPIKLIKHQQKQRDKAASVLLTPTNKSNRKDYATELKSE